MNRAKGIAIFVVLAAALAAIAFGALKTVSGGGGSPPTDKQVGALLAANINDSLAQRNLQGGVSAVGCVKQAKADPALQLAKGDYFCTVALTSPTGSTCLAFAFALQGNALPADNKIRAATIPNSYCGG